MNDKLTIPNVPDNSLTETPPAKGQPLLLTNRFNLLVCLGARLIQPREAYRKYYRDLLESAPGHIPLIDHAPSSALIGCVTAGAANSFPVLIEFNDLKGLQSERVEGGWLVNGAIPFQYVTAIHFPDERSLREHEARPYANIHPHQHLLTVSPTLFAGGPEEGDHDLLMDPQEEAAGAAGPDWNRLDRVRGALGAVVAGVVSDRTLGIAEALLKGNPAGAGEDACLVAGMMGWADPLKPSSKRLSLEEILLRAALEVLVNADVTQAWKPREILSLVSERIAAANIAKAQRQTMERNLALVASIVAGERDFEPFRTTAQGLTSAKALLLVLLREDLERLLSWPQAETGADDVTRQIAALFAGALRGISRENVEVRSVAVDDLTAISTTDLPGVPSMVERSTEDGRVTLLVRGVMVAQGDRPQKTVAGLLDELSGEERDAIQLELCHRLKWLDLVLTTVVFEGPINLSQDSLGIVVAGSALSVKRMVSQSGFCDRLESGVPDPELVQEVITAARMIIPPLS